MRCAARALAIEQPADRVYEVDVARFVARPDKISLTDAAAIHNPAQSRHMILDMQPITNIHTLPVDRQWFLGDRVQYG